jgi:hypothetical protein
LFSTGIESPPLSFIPSQTTSNERKKLQILTPAEQQGKYRFPAFFLVDLPSMLLNKASQNSNSLRLPKYNKDCQLFFPFFDLIRA